MSVRVQKEGTADVILRRPALPGRPSREQLPEGEASGPDNFHAVCRPLEQRCGPMRAAVEAACSPGSRGAGELPAVYPACIRLLSELSQRGGEYADRGGFVPKVHNALAPTMCRDWELC